MLAEQSRKEKSKRERERPSEKETENGWQFYHHSLLLFPHQLLAVVVVVIVYRFGRRLALLRFFSPFFSALDVSGRSEVEVFSIQTSLQSSHLSITDIVLLLLLLLFPFSSLLLHTMKIDTRN